VVHDEREDRTYLIEPEDKGLRVSLLRRSVERVESLLEQSSMHVCTLDGEGEYVSLAVLELLRASREDPIADVGSVLEGCTLLVHVEREVGATLQEGLADDHERRTDEERGQARTSSGDRDSPRASASRSSRSLRLLLSILTSLVLRMIASVDARGMRDGDVQIRVECKKMMFQLSVDPTATGQSMRRRRRRATHAISAAGKLTLTSSSEYSISSISARFCRAKWSRTTSGRQLSDAL
jgi:hypothetical protein